MKSLKYHKLKKKSWKESLRKYLKERNLNKMSINAATNVGNAGLVQTIFQKLRKAGKKTLESKEAEVQIESEEIIRSVEKTYNAKGEIIEPHYIERRYDGYEEGADDEKEIDIKL